MSSCLDYSVSKTFRNNRDMHDEKQLSGQRSGTVFTEEMIQSFEHRSNRNHDLHTTAVSIKVSYIVKRKLNKIPNSVALKGMHT